MPGWSTFSGDLAGRPAAFGWWGREGASLVEGTLLTGWLHLRATSIGKGQRLAAALRTMKMQNTSHAVMAQRVEPSDSPDDFPTPPWATRALIEHVIGPQGLSTQSCLEPACGRGHMSRPLAEYFATVESSDAFDYGFGAVRDFLDRKSFHSNMLDPRAYDWVITNPPFRLAEEFALRGLEIAKRGVALLTRTVFLESCGRYLRLFREIPPSKVAQFVERVPMVKGRLDQKASTATGYAWLVWEKDYAGTTPQLLWVPPCRKGLERAGDYKHSSLHES